MYVSIALVCVQCVHDLGQFGHDVIVTSVVAAHVTLSRISHSSMVRGDSCVQYTTTVTLALYLHTWPQADQFFTH